MNTNDGNVVARMAYIHVRTPCHYRENTPIPYFIRRDKYYNIPRDFLVLLFLIRPPHPAPNHSIIFFAHLNLKGQSFIPPLPPLYTRRGSLVKKRSDIQVEHIGIFMIQIEHK